MVLTVAITSISESHSDNHNSNSKKGRVIITVLNISVKYMLIKESIRRTKEKSSVVFLSEGENSDTMIYYERKREGSCEYFRSEEPSFYSLTETKWKVERKTGSVFCFFIYCCFLCNDIYNTEVCTYFENSHLGFMGKYVHRLHKKDDKLSTSTSGEQLNYPGLLGRLPIPWYHVTKQILPLCYGANIFLGLMWRNQQ